MSSPAGRVLVVDDEAELRGLLQRYLAENGYFVRAADGGQAMDQALAREPYDAIILDLVMPGEDGLAICRRLRAAGEDIPIIMLTARGDPIDRILGIEMGADDYLAKPFTPRELLARLGAVLRRAAGRAPRRGNGETFTFGPFVLDYAAMKLSRDGCPVTLSTREYSLLAVLTQHAGRPLSRSRIIDLAFGRNAEVTDRAVDVQITRLRKALGDDSDDPQWIKTVWGVGYVLMQGAPS